MPYSRTQHSGQSGVGTRKLGYLGIYAAESTGASPAKCLTQGHNTVASPGLGQENWVTQLFMQLSRLEPVEQSALLKDTTQWPARGWDKKIG